jgi:hypothetical protein
MATAVVTVEGVLRTMVGNRIIPEGARLYKALKSVGQVVLVTGEYDTLLESWMALEGLPRADNIMDELSGLDDYGRILNAIRAIWRYNVDLVIDSDPDYVALAFSRGYNTLLFTHAQFAHPDWRPDAGHAATPWNSLVGRVHDDLTAKANDKRLQDKDE